jgi:hypothetical protein
MKTYKIRKYTEVVPFSFCYTPNGNFDILLEDNKMKITVVDWEFDEFHLLTTDWALANGQYYYVILNQTNISVTGDEIIGFRVLRQWVDEL